MTLLLVALATFIVWNAFPRSSPGEVLRAKLGKGFGPAFGIGSALLFALLLWSFRGADRSLLYEPPAWGVKANYVLSLIGFICLGIFAFRGKARNMLRYPLALGAVFWGAGHLLANGETASVTLIAGLVVTVLLSTYMRGARAPGEVRQGHDLLGPLFGVAFYAIAVQIHQALVGVPVFELIK